MKNNDLLSTLELEDFTNWQHSVWFIVFDKKSTPIKATLSESRPHFQQVDAPRRGFSVLFIAEQFNQFYPQGVYILVHPSLGEIQLFMVPIGPDQACGKMQYEIIIA